MKISCSLFMCAALCTCGVSGSTDEQSNAVLERARSATAGTHSIRSSVRLTFRLDQTTVAYMGEFRALKPNAGELRLSPKNTQMRAEIAKIVGPPARSVYGISDGTTAFLVTPEVKQYSRRRAAEKGKDLTGLIGGSAATRAPAAAFFDPDQLRLSDPTRYLGVRERDGRRYEVVQFVENDLETDYFFGPEGLLEGMEVPKAGESFWLEHPQLNVELKRSDFEYSPPRHFKRVE